MKCPHCQQEIRNAQGTQEVARLLERIQLRDDALGGVMDSDLYNEITEMLQRIKAGRVKVIR